MRFSRLSPRAFLPYNVQPLRVVRYTQELLRKIARKEPSRFTQSVSGDELTYILELTAHPHTCEARDTLGRYRPTNGIIHECYCPSRAVGMSTREVNATEASLRLGWYNSSSRIIAFGISMLALRHS